MRLSNANLFRRYDWAQQQMAIEAMPGLRVHVPAPQPALTARIVEHVVVARRGNLRLVKAVTNG